MQIPVSAINESNAEATTLEWFEGLGYACKNGLQIAPVEPAAKRDSFGEVALVGRFCDAIWRLNPAVPEVAQVYIRQDRVVQIERSANP